MDPQRSWNVGYWITAVFLLLILQDLWQSASEVETVPYSVFEQALVDGRIAEVLVSAQSLMGRLDQTAQDDHDRGARRA